MCTREVFGPEGCGKAVADAVGVGQNFILSVERGNRNRGSENLFLICTAIVREVIDNGRFDKPSVAAASVECHGISAENDVSALLFGKVDIGKNFFVMLF